MKRAVPNLPSYPQKAIHVSLAKTEDIKKETKSNRKIPSNEDLIIETLPSQIHLITSKRINREERNTNTIPLTFSVESYGSGTINHGITKRIVYKTPLCNFEIISNTEETGELFSFNMLDSK